ncbi:MAG: HAMP domain-containing histidine kinase [Desulfobacterota bacterium]|nr:HAMP domain-containing histidine kinase [Thermodesulfobacteriota bacterium]MDW8001586.1 HAMP domain-containing sensor histidine kinase [Deltaproteobacteria bacterium]
MRLFRDPKNLRYNITTLVPVLVFLVCILIGLFTLNVAAYVSYPEILLLGISAVCAFLVFLVLFAMTAPIKDMVRKLDSLYGLGPKKMKGRMIEIYELIEKLVAEAKLNASKTENEHKIATIERLEYIIPLGFMALVIAHEVRNPLSTVVGMAQLLLEKADPEEELYLRRILEATKRIDAFTKELLDFTDTEPSIEEFDLTHVVEEAYESLKREFPTVRSTFLAEKHAHFVGDKNKIYQAVYNIIKNAFEAERNAGYLQVKIEDGDPISISVYNQSSKIGEEEKKLLFRPFYTTKKEGRGLGLFIAEKNVKLHNGHIEVNTDGGTEFRIVLPKR